MSIYVAEGIIDGPVLTNERLVGTDGLPRRGGAEATARPWRAVAEGTPPFVVQVFDISEQLSQCLRRSGRRDTSRVSTTWNGQEKEKREEVGTNTGRVQDR